MERRIGLAVGIDAARIIRLMFRGIPAPAAQIDAAGEGDLVIDHYQLLMMRGAFGMAAVEAKVKAWRRLQAQPQGRQQFPLGRIDHIEIPGQQIDTQLGLALHQ